MGTRGHTAEAAPLGGIATPTFESVGWSADGGVPVELLDGSVLYLFGDTVKPGSFVHNSAVIVGGGYTMPLWHPNGLLPDTVAGTWYWPSDAIDTEDGLIVVANEMADNPDSWFGFKVVDTDLFVVAAPGDVESWRLAEKFDVGPWDGYNVSFVNERTAVLRAYGTSATHVADLTEDPWFVSAYPLEMIGAQGPGDGLFVPAHHDGWYYGVTWNMASGNVVLWKGASLARNATFRPVDYWAAEPNSYGHQLHEVNGELVYVRSVPGNGYELGRSTAFPAFETLTIEAS